MGRFPFEVKCEESTKKLLGNILDRGRDRGTRSMDEMAGTYEHSGGGELAP